MLQLVRQIHHLPPHYFDPIPGYFPLSSQEFKEILSNPLTSDSVLIPLCDSYEQYWDSACLPEQMNLVTILVEHMNATSPLSSGPHSSLPGKDFLPPSDLPTSTFNFVQSQRGLQLLRFVNEKLINGPASPWSWAVENIGWMDALDHVQNLHGLQLGCFREVFISNVRIKGSSDDFHMPRNKMTEKESEVERFNEIALVYSEDGEPAGVSQNDSLPMVDGSGKIVQNSRRYSKN
ncbi:hypothetical protein L218DRAFT_1006152 [Marasmius fiardii PR-910]|nr:hypothetical protein L218DRAFT_1006152 [Marasmius fiardii PR-910]